MSASERTVSGIPIDAVYGGGPGVPDGLPPPPENTNERFRHLLREDQTGLSVAFDMPTLMGYDSHARRHAELVLAAWHGHVDEAVALESGERSARDFHGRDGRSSAPGSG